MINVINEANRFFIEAIAIERYKSLLSSMSDEQLGYEYADRIGNELREFELIMSIKGRDEVIRRLMDNYITTI